MSYKCDRCGGTPPAGTPCKKIVTKKIQFLHPERQRAKKGVMVGKNGKKKTVWIPDPGGWGDQILHEKKMCPACAHNWEKEERQFSPK